MVKKDKSENKKVGSYMKEKLGDVTMLSEVSSEITYQIPTHYSGKFKEFFEQFDRDLERLDIKSYGISITTLEEVFLRVGHGLEHEKVDNINIKQEELLKEAELIPKVNENLDEYTIVEHHEQGAFNVFWIHLIALFRKRI